MEFLFDYYHEGMPVTTMIGDGEDLMQHAVQVTVSGGKIIKFKMLLRSYFETDRTREFINIYRAIDKIASRYVDAETAVKIDDLYPAYMEDGKSENLKPCWVGYVDGKRLVLSN
jgi:hypothetical protein